MVPLSFRDRKELLLLIGGAEAPEEMLLTPVTDEEAEL